MKKHPRKFQGTHKMTKIADESLKEFVDEVEEMLDQLTANIQKVEQKKQDEDTLNAIYRQMHTIKGSSQLFGFNKIGHIGHAMEAFLDPVRKRISYLSDEKTNILFSSLDYISRQLNYIKNNGCEEDQTKELKELIPKIIYEALTDLGQTPYGIRDSHLLGHSIGSTPSEIENLKQKSMQPKDEQEKQSAQNDRQQERQENPSLPDKKPLVFYEPPDSVRVSKQTLENLMDLAGELVLIRNRVISYSTKKRDKDFHSLSQHINTITTKIQNEVMQTQKQPIESIFLKLHRKSMEFAKSKGKDIELSIEGSETEFDRSLTDIISEPLTNIILNAIEHGVENPAKRRGRHKKEKGQIVLSAAIESGQIAIRIKDDGAGIDPGAIQEIAIRNKSIQKTFTSSWSHSEIYKLILYPGITTKTNLDRKNSLCVAKESIENIGGSIELQSTFGKGTTVVIKLPFSVAIVSSLIVSIDHQKFAIPQNRIRELVSVNRGKNSDIKVSTLQGTSVISIRGHIIPLIELGESHQNSIEDDRIFAVLHERGRLFGIEVQRIEDSADIVIKQLPNFLKLQSIYSGSAVLGDGSISLVLDISKIADRSNLIRGGIEGSEPKIAPITQPPTEPISEFLIVEIGNNRYFGIPLHLVFRLENFSESKITQSGKASIIHYDQQTIPLLDFRNDLGCNHDDPDGPEVKSVIVRDELRYYGIIVSEIIEVFRSDQSFEDQANPSEFILGNVVRNGRGIPILHMQNLLDRHRANFSHQFKSPQVKAIESRFKRKGNRPEIHHVLYLEDSEFFRKQISLILSKKGFKVSLATNGTQGLDMIKRSPKAYSLIITDIEMPEMGGIEFTKKLRAQFGPKELPIIALSTKYRKQDIETGLEAGIDTYLYKLDETLLFEAISNLLKLDETV